MHIKQHEFPEGKEFCKHCNGKKGTEGTCVARNVDQFVSRPRYKVMDDLDTIHSRILEIRKENDEALKNIKS